MLFVSGEGDGETEAALPAGQAALSWSLRDGPANYKRQQRWEILKHLK